MTNIIPISANDFDVLYNSILKHITQSRKCTRMNDVINCNTTIRARKCIKNDTAKHMVKIDFNDKQILTIFDSIVLDTEYSDIIDYMTIGGISDLLEFSMYSKDELVHVLNIVPEQSTAKPALLYLIRRKRD